MRAILVLITEMLNIILNCLNIILNIIFFFSQASLLIFEYILLPNLQYFASFIFGMNFEPNIRIQF